MKLWAGRFKKQTSHLVDEYNASISFDYQLAKYDIKGSLAHASMLQRCGFISEEDLRKIKTGLLQIQEKIANHEIQFQLSDEDIHMAIERMLHEEIGEVAGKLHTGRSRNDQVSLDIHLYLRDQVTQIVELLHGLLSVIYNLAKEHVDTIFPGYTHLQRAEPIRFAHHMLAYFNMFARDVDRLCASYPRINKNPLGAGALAGSGVNIDCHYVAGLLHFESLYSNSLDAVSDRDFVVEFLSNASLMMMHFSKLSEEMILWCSQEFSFIELDDAFCTGSSMMPQKKNPDVCELARGKTGRVYGALMGLLTTLKGLPLAYNKDMQEDKEGLFDTVKTVMQTLSVFTPMLESMKVNKSITKASTENDFSNATNFANYLVYKGITFRQSHEITGKIVSYCIKHHKLLNDMKLSEFHQFCEKIEEDVYSFLAIEAVIEAHTVQCGTAKKSIVLQIEEAKETLKTIRTWLDRRLDAG